MTAPTVIEIKKDVFTKNNRIAVINRAIFKETKVTALNFVSSPGAGKTSLLVKTISEIKDKINFAVIEGDQQTDNDARRIAKTGAQVTQINTMSACHLDASMTLKALDHIDLTTIHLLMIENVGNLVCPASYDLGEKMKVALVSVTEGDDKPAKYPNMFRASKALVITKTDLLPYVDFDVDKCVELARNINPEIRLFTLSVSSGEGLDEWYSFLTGLKSHEI